MDDEVRLTEAQFQALLLYIEEKSDARANASFWQDQKLQRRGRRRS